jgi:hypothetical protein
LVLIYSCFYLQNHVPTREEKQNLLQSRQGEQKITFVKSADPMDFTIKIEEKFPKLKDIGGYELLRIGISSRFKLEPIQIPPGGYTTEHLADCSMLGQALCFLRPIQRDLSLEDSPMEVKVSLLKFVYLVGMRWYLSYLYETLCLLCEMICYISVFFSLYNYYPKTVLFPIQNRH